MHFDDSVENIADSDLEEGELRKMLTSPLYAQKAPGKPDALVVHEREVSAQLTQADRKESLRSHSSKYQKASGKPDALFSSEQGNLIRSSSFRNANPSNLRGSLLEWNKDHLLNEARSDMVKQELHVQSLNKCIGELQRQNGRAKIGITGRTIRICWNKARTSSTTRRIVYERKFSEIAHGSPSPCLWLPVCFGLIHVCCVLRGHVLVCAVEPPTAFPLCGMPRQDGIGDKAPTLCCGCVASSWHAHLTIWNCGVGDMCADCHGMCAPPLEWADWSAQSLLIIFSALISSKLLMQHGFLLSFPSSFALSKHTISSPIYM